MGRPKGSKNKVKVGVNAAVLQADPHIKPTMVPVTPKRVTKAKLDPMTTPLKKRKGAEVIVEQPPESVAAAKAALLAAMRAPLSPAETAKLLKEAQAEAAKVRDPQLVVNDAVAQVIKPNWNNAINQDGCKHFYVKSQWNGESVSFEVEKWQRALQEHRLPSGNITFKIEGMGMEPGGGTGAPMWRVMIG